MIICVYFLPNTSRLVWETTYASWLKKPSFPVVKFSMVRRMVKTILERQRIPVRCHDDAGTESQVELQAITQVMTQVDLPLNTAWQ
jgi:hypothetical protein